VQAELAVAAVQKVAVELRVKVAQEVMVAAVAGVAAELLEKEV